MRFLLAIFYFLFSIVSSLGPLNPFDIRDAIGGTSSPLTLAIQGPFIILLLLSVKVKYRFLKMAYLSLCILAGLSLCSTLAFTDGPVPDSYFLQLLKLILCIILFYKLPSYLQSRPKLMAWGFIGFSSVSVTIAVLYMMGFLDKYCIFGGGRLVLFYENANAYSTRMVISMFFIAYLVANNPLRWGKYRFILLIAEFPLLYIVLASGSRGSLIFMLVGFLVYLSYLPMRRIAHKIALITVISLAGVGGVTYILNNNQDFGIMERMSRSIENGDDAGRSTLSAATLQIWSENPVFGVGAVDFSQQMFWRFRLTRTVHSVYWYTLVTTGICGLLALIFFLVILGREVFRVRHKDPMPLTLYVIMILLASKTGGALAYIIMWYVFAISATLSMRCLKK